MQQPNKNYEKPFAVVIDLESTGTNRTMDYILEIGAVAVDDELEVVADISAVIKVSKEQLRQGTWPGFWQMHGINGLINDCLNNQERISILEADAMLCQWLEGLGYAPGEVILAGNSIGQFDIPMIHAQMPITAKMLHHRAIDISAQARELARVVKFKRSEKKLPHRALEDCYFELEEWRDQGVFLRDLRDAAVNKTGWGFAIQKY